MGGYKMNEMHDVIIGEGDSPLADVFDKVRFSMYDWKFVRMMLN